MGFNEVECTGKAEIRRKKKNIWQYLTYSRMLGGEGGGGGGVFGRSGFLAEGTLICACAVDRERERERESEGGGLQP